MGLDIITLLSNRCLKYTSNIVYSTHSAYSANSLQNKNLTVQALKQNLNHKGKEARHNTNEIVILGVIMSGTKIEQAKQFNSGSATSSMASGSREIAEAALTSVGVVLRSATIPKRSG